MVEQAQRRAAYEQWREDAAAARVRQTGLLKQLAHSRDEFYAAIDDEHLETCSLCHESSTPRSTPPTPASPRRRDAPTARGPPDTTTTNTIHSTHPPTCPTRKTTYEQQTRTTRPLRSARPAPTWQQPNAISAHAADSTRRMPDRHTP